MTNVAPPPPAWSDRPAAEGMPGGFWIRFVAYMIDALIITAVTAVLVGVFAGFILLTDQPVDHERPTAPIILGVLLLIFATIAVNWLYEALMTSSPSGATLGKMALGLRIVRFDGAQLSFGRATARHFLKYMITPLVPFFIGYLMAAFTNRKRALHDMLADTLVIRSS